MEYYIGKLVSGEREITRATPRDGGRVGACFSSIDGALAIIIWYDKEAGCDCYDIIQKPYRGRGVDEQIATGILGKPQVGAIEAGTLKLLGDGNMADQKDIKFGGQSGEVIAIDEFKDGKTMKVKEGYCPECGGELDNLQDVTEDSGNKFFRMGCPICKKVFQEQYVESFFGFAIFDGDGNYTGETQYTHESDLLQANASELLEAAQAVLKDILSSQYRIASSRTILALQVAVSKTTKKPE